METPPAKIAMSTMAVVLKPPFFEPSVGDALEMLLVPPCPPGGAGAAEPVGKLVFSVTPGTAKGRSVVGAGSWLLLLSPLVALASASTSSVSVPHAHE